MKTSYEICWQILRLGKDHPTIKMAGTNCPCKYDPENNRHCPKYEKVKVNSQ